MSSENVIYVVDPDEEMSRSLAALLDGYSIKVNRFANAESFLSSAQHDTIGDSCLLLELDLPDGNGMSLLRQLRNEHQQLPIIAMGAQMPDEGGQHAKDAGATDYIEKSLIAAYLFHRLADFIPGADRLPHTAPSIMELADGTPVTFRMTHPEDADLQQSFITGLSERSRYMRFFSGLTALPKHVLKEFTTPRFPLSYAVVAIISDGLQDRQIGVARWAPTGAEGVAEFAVVVADDSQGQGIASKLMRVLVVAATVGGLQRLEGLILKENAPMLALVRKLGFVASPDHDAGPSVALYIKELREPSS